MAARFCVGCDHVVLHFKTLRKEGVIPKHVRFQIAMPAVNSVVTPRAFPKKGDLEKVRPGYEEALAAEIDTIVRSIPHEDLALQWDFSWEITQRLWRAAGRL